MSKYLEEAEEITFSEPILAQEGVRLGISFVEKSEWEVKQKDKWTAEGVANMQEYLGRKFDACKLTLTIADDSVRTEHEDAKPKMTIEDQFNIEKFPYPDKDSGKVKWLGRQKLYELEGVFGFDPVFKVGDDIVEPFITKNGNKVAPKVEGVVRVLNPDFFNAYFSENGEPIKDNWIGKTVYANVTVEKSEKFGDKNAIGRYVKAPTV